MFRKHGEEFVVKTTEVWPMIPANRSLSSEEMEDANLVRLFEEYQQFLENGGVPLEQEAAQ